MITLFPVTYRTPQLSSNPPTNKASWSAFLKPVGVVLLPRRSGTLNSSLCLRQQIRNPCNYRPRIPRAQRPFGLFHTLLRFVVGVVDFFWRLFYLHLSCKSHHQSPPEPSTRHHWRWNTIVCSNHGSHRGEKCHSKRRGGLFYGTFSWKHIPIEI